MMARLVEAGGKTLGPGKLIEALVGDFVWGLTQGFTLGWYETPFGAWVLVVRAFVVPTLSQSAREDGAPVSCVKRYELRNGWATRQALVFPGSQKRDLGNPASDPDAEKRVYRHISLRTTG